MSHHRPNAPRNQTPASRASASPGSASHLRPPPPPLAAAPALVWAAEAVDDEDGGGAVDEPSAGTATMEKRPNEWNA